MRRYVFHLAILSLAALAPGLARGGDQEIAQQIIEKLQAEKQAGTLKKFSIDLQVDEGTVWLTGRVASEEQQYRALDLARRVPGVRQVVNDLTIAAPQSKPLAVAKSAPAPASTPPIAFAAAPQPSYSAPAPPLPPSIEAVPIQAEPLPVAQAEPAQDFQAASVPAPAFANATPESSERRSNSPAYNPMFNSVSKALMSAVGGGRTLDEPAKKGSSSSNMQLAGSKVQHASGSQELVKSASPIGSGVDASAAPRRAVVQAAQPVANVPQVAAAPQALPANVAVTSADGLQPLSPVAPQVAMVPMQMPYMMPMYAGPQPQVPLAMGPARTVNYVGGPAGAVPMGAPAAPMPMVMPGSGVGIAPARYDHPQMPGYAWPSYAAYPNYAAVTYPKQYSPTAWPYIGPFYPYPQVPLGWRKVTLEWDDGWWMLDFKDRRSMYNH